MNELDISTTQSPIKSKPIFGLGVVSGKGGVGKTMLTASLLYYLNNKGCKLFGLDCDVDAPNLGLLFKAEKVICKKTIQTTMKATFLNQNCVSCAKCIEDSYCNFQALLWDDVQKYPVIDQYSCEGCGACEELCASKAFKVVPVDSGTIEYITTPFGFPLITGETILGASTTGKLITELRKFATENAKMLGSELILLDGPPGIGCPVIASISGLKYAIVIVEPTPTAIHDAKRVIGIINQLNIPFGIVINKADSWESGRIIIETYCRESEIEILGEIPVDFCIPESISAAVPVLAMKKSSPAITELEKIGARVYEIVQQIH